MIPRNPWVLTHSGIEFDLLGPTPAIVNLEDLAYSLARVARFNGHARAHCSVALHSVIVSRAAEGLFLKRHALLHDAHEAYIGDIASPVKRLLGGALIDLTYPVQRAIERRFGLEEMTEQEAGEVHRLDLMALNRERALFMPPSSEWGVEEKGEIHIPDDLLEIYHRGPECHEELFLNEAERLGIK